MTDEKRRTKAVPTKQQNLDQKINDSKISYLDFFFFEKIISGIHSFLFFQLQIFQEKVSKTTKSSKKDHTFYKTVLLILRTATHLTLKIICSRNTAKNLSDFTSFQQTCFCSVSGNIFVLHHFPRPNLKSIESKSLYISIYLLNKTFVPETQ